MSGETKYLWMDGELKLWNEGTIHVMSHALHYGSAFFEGIKCYHTDRGPAVFRLKDHMKRLHESTSIYKMPMPFTVDELQQAVISLIKANELQSCYIRPIAFYGYDTLGVHPKKCPTQVAIATFDWGAYLGEGALENGVRITISPWRKFHSSSLPTVAKAAGQYLNSILAAQDAQSKGFDEGLLLNQDGNIAEGAGQNLFIVKNDEIYTNAEDSCILMGITRETIIKLLSDLGFAVHIGKLSIGQLFNADEAFFTGTASEVTPIREVDERKIGNGMRGSVTKSIQKTYFEVIKGENAKYDSWLTYINK
ncbi:MAG: branched-chain amino acid transaminase [Candidatus Marinimicrobia bacterium]|nr:branched-chain amino acid transaminase [Candidatus Neomarinimicrobiota bacterium]